MKTAPTPPHDAAFRQRWKTRTFSALISAASTLPLSALHSIGRFTGQLFWRLPTRERTITLTNLQLCFPAKSDAQRAALAVASLEHTGRALWEIGAMWRWQQSRLTKLVVNEVNRDLFEHAVSQGRGVILASPHIGAWELIAIHIGTQHPMVNMYRPSRSAAMDPVILEARSRFGCEAAPASPRGVRMVLKALRQNKVVGILPDQEPDRESGIFAPFFGVPACTMTLLGKLAAKSQAPVVFCVMKRLKHGFEMHYLAAPSAVSDPDPAIASAALNQMVEACVHIAPEQYLWSYKRFSLLPEGGKRRYRKPG